MDPIEIAIAKQLSAQDRRGIISPAQLAMMRQEAVNRVQLDLLQDPDPWRAERLIHEAIDAKYFLFRARDDVKPGDEGNPA